MLQRKTKAQIKELQAKKNLGGAIFVSRTNTNIVG